MSEPTHCWVYRSSRKEEMYLYLAREEAFEEVPKALMARFGTPTLVMTLELTPQRKLAREEVTRVLTNLQKQGFHLQLPPTIRPEFFLSE